MSLLETSKFMATKDKKQGSIVAPSDFIMKIQGFEHLTFNVKTNGLPVIKNDKIEYTTPHGVKMVDSGVIQTLNSLPVTFMERENKTVEKEIEGILASGENEELVIEFYMGKDLKNAVLWGTLENASIFTEDSPEADSEGTTSAFTLTKNISGHYYPQDVKTVDVLSILG